MRIVKQTPNLLMLKARKSAIFSYLFQISIGAAFSTMFLTAGINTMLAEGKITLKCKRLEPTQVRCEMIYSGLLGERRELILLGALQKAQIDVSFDEDDDKYYYLTLISGARNIPLKEYGGDTRCEAEKYVHTINKIIDDSQSESISLSQDNRLWHYLASFFLMAVTIYMIYYVLFRAKLQVSCTFDKEARQLQFIQFSLFKLFYRSSQGLDDIKEIKLAIKTMDEWEMHVMKIMLISGHSIPIEIAHRHSDYRVISRAVHQFLWPESKEWQA